ncbi:unnamed protein product [Pleuronectes platessa]|uniref:Uncharacterized protein n=1 Tax=Pleuronectes platessa TaxID=8262 RepID=A0A9N7Y6I7_PLEPL|nr:unnamed protein product [Pleuronectes platessa]
MSEGDGSTVLGAQKLCAEAPNVPEEIHRGPWINIVPFNCLPICAEHLQRSSALAPSWSRLDAERKMGSILWVKLVSMNLSSSGEIELRLGEKHKAPLHLSDSKSLWSRSRKNLFQTSSSQEPVDRPAVHSDNYEHGPEPFDLC